jgi:hypothetical protein
MFYYNNIILDSPVKPGNDEFYSFINIDYFPHFNILYSIFSFLPPAFTVDSMPHEIYNSLKV